LTSTLDFRKAIFTIHDELQNSKTALPLIQANINILLLEMIRQNEQQRMNALFGERWDPDKRVVYSMAESIVLGMDEHLTIKNFAIAQHLNPNRLKILFKKHMGMPAAAFRISVRMQKARQLLTETNLSIQEICTLVGYTNPTQFSTMFKRKMGCSPSQLRKELSGVVPNSLHGS
jgi:AraC-like DNA-binding protein